MRRQWFADKVSILVFSYFLFKSNLFCIELSLFVSFVFFVSVFLPLKHDRAVISAAHTDLYCRLPAYLFDMSLLLTVTHVSCN